MNLAEHIPNPSNIERGTALIQGAADNIDIIVETSDGKETTHATSMVLYQHHSVDDDTNHELQDIDSPDFLCLMAMPPKNLGHVFLGIHLTFYQGSNASHKDKLCVFTRLNGKTLQKGNPDDQRVQD